MGVRPVIRILMIAGAVAALLICGWGIRAAASFFISVPRAAFLALILIAITGATANAKNPMKKGTRTPAGQRFVLASVQVVTLPLLAFLPYADKRRIFVIQAEWVRWMGLGSALLGFTTMLVALHTLGKNYSAYVTIQEKHSLVQSGIYSVVRNPIYLGTMLFWPGACLVFRSWLAFPVFAYFLCFGVLRGVQEERVLREHFATEFEAYCQRTWRLVPYVY